jgi:molybdenum cofactor cytidylyltransferase
LKETVKTIYMPEIWAIILAAGESGRMQTNKLLLPYNGKTMIETVIDHVRQSATDHILVVTGAYSDELLPVINRLPVKPCYNNDYKKGMLSSVQCGFRNIPATAEAVMIFLGDQPSIPGGVAGMLISEYRKSEKGIIIPVYKGRRGHPMLIDCKYRDIIGKLDHAVGLRDLLHKYPDDVLEVNVEMPGILKDIDTPQDYRALTKSK